MPLDRQSAGIGGAVRAQFPESIFLRHYSGKVVSQRGPNSFDFQPDDTAMPGMSAIPMKLPHPGLGFNLVPGAPARAVVVFPDASPANPEIHLWESPGLETWELDASQSATIASPAINLGAALAIHPMILGDIYLLTEAALFAALASIIATVATNLNSAGAQPSYALAAPFITAAGAALEGAAAAFGAYDAAAPEFPSEIVKASG